MLDFLELRIAKSKIRRYQDDADESIIRASKQAQDCMDCEAFLDTGINALEWLERCEEGLVAADREGIFEFSAELQSAIEKLRQGWMNPCEYARKWIAKCQKNGYHIRNLVKFDDCCRRAEEWLDRNSQYKLSVSTREERFAQEPW